MLISTKYLLLSFFIISPLIATTSDYPTWITSSDTSLVSQLKIIQPNVVVAQDGTGHYKTIMEAVNSCPMNNQKRYIIYIKTGIYNEYIDIGKKNKIFVYGDGPTKTVITGRKNSKAGLDTSKTPTFRTSGEDFIAKSITFENTAGPQGKQAVALFVEGDRSAFFDCAIRGYQDTLCVEKGRQFYRNCTISGTVDFIFGQTSTTLIQKSTILVRKPGPNQQNVIVASGRYNNTPTQGIVLQNCVIMPDNELLPYISLVKSYLARPWGSYARAVFIGNHIGNFIQPQGFLIWNLTHPRTKNSYFAECDNVGPGAHVRGRVKWARGKITQKEATQFTAEPWLHARAWLPSTSIPYTTGFETPRFELN